MRSAVEGLRANRSAVLILVGMALIVAGIWTVVAALAGAAIGAGVGSALTGVALLLVESLSEGAS